MGILDDLKSQAEQKNKPAGEQRSSASAEEFYLAQVKQRMIMANNFLTQLVNQLNEMKLVIKADYPFRPEGKNVTLLQQGYKVYSDHITDPRQITLSITCILANPTTFDVRGRAPALAQGELLERYQFKYEKLEARDQNRMVIGARFKLQGPLQVKCILEFDEAKQIIKLLLTNFVGPGTSQYNLRPEQLDETFMDHLGKYLLRKEAKLFQEEISDDAKAMLRKKLQQEQLQREAELHAVEEQRKAEEAARKQNSATGQLKKAVSQSVAENREKLKKVMDEQVREKGEKLKTMFNKLKNRAGSETAPERSSASPPVNTSQTARPTANPAVQGLPPVNRQAGQTASAQQNATRPKPPAAQKQATPPKVFVSSASNPFLKPEDFEPVAKVGEEQTEVNADTKNPAAQLPAETATPAKTVNPFLQTKAAAVLAETKKPAGQSPAQTATPATPTMSPAAEAKPVAAPNASVAKTANPFLQTKAAAVLAETKKPTGQSPAQTATPATPMMSPTTAQAKSVVESNASVAKTANPFLQTKPPVAPAESGLSLEPIASDSESSSSSPAAPDEPKLSLESTASGSETSSPAALAESSLSLEPIASDAESSSPTAPVEPKLSLEPTASDAESSSPVVPDEPKLSQETIVSDAESSSPAAPAESSLSLEPIASDSESSSPVVPDEPSLALEPTASDAESSSPAAPAEPKLSLEPTASDAESSSPAAPAEPKLSLKPTASGSESSSVVIKTQEPQPEPSSDRTSLSLEDQLERDLARFMENDQQQPSLEGETSDDPSSTSGELDFDLSSPEALKIYFEDTDKASDQDNSEPKK